MIDRDLPVLPSRNFLTGGSKRNAIAKRHSPPKLTLIMLKGVLEIVHNPIRSRSPPKPQLRIKKIVFIVASIFSDDF